MTGGELVAAAKERMDPFWSVTRSQVYRELPGLAQAGYVRPGKLGPRAAQPYAITAAGKRAFRSWLTESAGADHARNPLVLRIGFGAHHAPGAVRQLVEDARGRHQEALAANRPRATQLKKEGATRSLVATAEFASRTAGPAALAGHRPHRLSHPGTGGPALEVASVVTDDVPAGSRSFPPRGPASRGAGSPSLRKEFGRAGGAAAQRPWSDRKMRSG